MTKVRKAPQPEEVQATIKELVRQTLKEALEAELEEFLGYSRYQRSDFRYPVEIRRVMYTTNIIESVNSKFRKVTAGRRVFPTDESLLKCLYMAAVELERKWRRPVRN